VAYKTSIEFSLHEETKETLAMLKILALANSQIDWMKVK
jgi:hypothetical protein